MSTQSRISRSAASQVVHASVTPLLTRELRTTFGPEVEIHARALNYPTHMEWTSDGRLLVPKGTADALSTLPTVAMRGRRK